MDKQPVSSNIQGSENDEPISQHEIITYDSNRQTLNPEHQPSGDIIKEKSDLCRLQDEDFRSRVTEIQSGECHKTSDNETQNNVSEYDPVVHADSKLARLHLTIRYNDKQSELIVQIIDAQGIIRPEQAFAPDMCLTFSLIGNDHVEHKTEKHERIIVANASVQWKEPIIFFCISFEKVIKQNLYIYVENHTDPSAPRNREVLIPLNNLQRQTEEINEWFHLQLVK